MEKYSRDFVSIVAEKKQQCWQNHLAFNHRNTGLRPWLQNFHPSGVLSYR